jgi:hypothetical protein
VLAKRIRLDFHANQTLPESVNRSSIFSCEMSESAPVDTRENALSDDERRDEGLRRMLKTKPKRHEDMKLGKPRNQRKKSKGKVRPAKTVAG